MQHVLYSPARWTLLAVAVILAKDARAQSAGQQPRDALLEAESTSRSVVTGTIDEQSNGNSAAQSSPRELLRLLRIGPEQFRELIDGRPVDAAERPGLLRFLQAAARVLPEEMEALSHDGPRWEYLVRNPDSNRGAFVGLRGTMLSLSARPLTPDEAQKYGFTRFYRAELEVEPLGETAVIYALRIPRAWKDGTDVVGRVSSKAIFLKLAGSYEADPLPMFVASRIAWHPHTVLGELGMDVGLFDDVDQRGRIERHERECFYQLLATADRDRENRIRTATRQRSFDLAPLLAGDTEHLRGELMAFDGIARRSIRIEIDDLAMQRRLEMDHYYELEVFTQQAGGWPIVVCTSRLPAEMPRGPNIHEPVRVAGFFFKQWSFHSPAAAREGPKVRQWAPLLIGAEPLWTPAPPDTASPLVAASLAAAFLAVLIGIWLAVWRAERGDRRFRRSRNM